MQFLPPLPSPIRAVRHDSHPRIRHNLAPTERGTADAVVAPRVSERGLRAGLLARLAYDPRRRRPADLPALPHRGVDMADAERAGVKQRARVGSM